jgi:hypothetical protein
MKADNGRHLLAERSHLPFAVNMVANTELNFVRVPGEGELEILKNMFPPCKIHVRIERRATIHDRVTLQPWWVLGRTWQPEHISYDYILSTNDEQSLLAESLMGEDTAVANMSRKQKPCYLQIDHGQRVFFHPDKDTIYFDLLSLCNLEHLTQSDLVYPLAVTGFDLIQRISTPLKRKHLHVLHSLLNTDVMDPTGPPLIPSLAHFLSGVRSDDQVTIRDYSFTTLRYIWELEMEDARMLKNMDMRDFRPSKRRQRLIREERQRLFATRQRQFLEYQIGFLRIPSIHPQTTPPIS